jgi:hypothetical protein
MKPHANGRIRGTHARADQIDRWANSRKRLLLMHPQPGASISYRCVRLLNSSRPFLPAIAFIPGGAAIGRVGTRSKSKYSALDRAGVIWPVRRAEADGRPREMPAELICRITHDGRGDHLVARPWAFWRLRLTASASHARSPPNRSPSACRDWRAPCTSPRNPAAPPVSFAPTRTYRLQDVKRHEQVLLRLPVRTVARCAHASTISAIPPRREATTGVPFAKASMMTRGKFS